MSQVKNETTLTLPLRNEPQMIIYKKIKILYETCMTTIQRRVQTCPDLKSALTNCVFVSPNDHKLNSILYVNVNGYIYRVLKHIQVKETHITLNALQRHACQVNEDYVVNVSQFDVINNAQAAREVVVLTTCASLTSSDVLSTLKHHVFKQGTMMFVNPNTQFLISTVEPSHAYVFCNENTSVVLHVSTVITQNYSSCLCFEPR